MTTTNNTPRIGARVLTRDGHVLGEVAEVLGSCFKVDKPMRPDEWLAKDIIATNGADVTLSITRDDMDGEPEGIEHLGYHVHRET